MGIRNLAMRDEKSACITSREKKTPQNLLINIVNSSDAYMRR